MTRLAFLAAILSIATIPAPLRAQESGLEGLSWTEQKCVLYKRAVADAMHILGNDGISAGFRAGNETFIAGGCIGRARICPRSEKEIDLVNMLTVMTMNEGMASTFVPFGCAN